LLRAAYFGYDANSNLVKTLDRNAVATYFGYDALDRRSAIQYPTETQYFGYDAGGAGARGNMVAMKDNWGASYFGYDALNRVAHRSPSCAVPPCHIHKWWNCRAHRCWKAPARPDHTRCS
jgi:YD repeat-containing protein